MKLLMTFLFSSRLFVLLLICLLFSCVEKLNNQKTAQFPREQEIKNYLEKIHNVDTVNDKIIFLIQTRFCGACSKEDFAFMSNDFFYDAIVISPDSIQNLTNQQFIDYEFNMEKYGLQLPYSYFLKFDADEKLTYWAILRKDNYEQILDTIAKHNQSKISTDILEKKY